MTQRPQVDATRDGGMRAGIEGNGLMYIDIINGRRPNVSTARRFITRVEAKELRRLLTHYIQSANWGAGE